MSLVLEEREGVEVDEVGGGDGDGYGPHTTESFTIYSYRRTKSGATDQL